ncbi:restriction system modified-DNA reader domain-containing protein [Parafrankia elaeagni]|uniref:restriction system modified-DNA reader domain-containing protein n=1 Tax=Parafrankia elaeagni TaxID=222534 RepID=UPI00035E2B9A|nr:type I restriction enzyme HsdR N-terminal domain-containing protein [Parafrankia elaeagni]
MARTLLETLGDCVRRLERYGGQRIGEQNTKASLIEPVIEALGWDIHDLDEVNREYRYGGSANPVDYALLLRRRPCLFIEAKGLGEDLGQLRWATQILSYASAAGVRWVVLTNGAEWRIYNAHAPVPVEQKLYRTVRPAESTDEAARVLELLGKDVLGSDRIEDLWRSEFVDGQVRSALTELFDGGEPAPELAALVRRRAPGLNEAEVRDALIRVRAAFDFPAAGLVSSVVPAPREALPAATDVSGSDSSSPGRTAGAGRSGPPELNGRPAAPATGANPSKAVPLSADSTRVTRVERDLGMTDLLAAGLVQAGSALTAVYRGRQREAQVRSDGMVSFGGQRLSLSAAGAAAKVDIVGPDLPESARSTDGWDFWKAPDPTTGRLVSLKRLRRDLAQSRPNRQGGRSA